MFWIFRMQYAMQKYLCACMCVCVRRVHAGTSIETTPIVDKPVVKATSATENGETCLAVEFVTTQNMHG